MINLKPLSALIEATPELICVALLRQASAPGPAEPKASGTWSAQRYEGTSAVRLTREEPQFSLVLQVSPQSEDGVTSVLWVTGEYRLKRARLHGVLERWQAQRGAEALRDELVETLRRSTASPEPQEQQSLRRAPRFPVNSTARLDVGERNWRAEVLNVSEQGIALVLASLPSMVDADVRYLQAHGDGEVDISLPGGRSRVAVLIRRVAPGRGGVQIGLEVSDPEALVPLLRKAQSRGGNAP